MDPPERAQTHAREIAADGEDVTALLEAVVAGDANALDRLVPLLYHSLREIAHHHRRMERPAHTLNTTAIVHEAYLRLAGVSNPSWHDRAHFLAVSSRIIRHVLIDYERRRTARKRGGEAIRVPLSEALAGDDAGPDAAVEFLALDAALQDLAGHEPRLERVVECRFFGGLTGRETAEVLGVSERTVERDWVRARAYLRRALRPVVENPE